MRFLLDM